MEKCKPKREDGYWFWYTLLLYMEDNSMTMKELKAYLRRSLHDHILSKLFYVQIYVKRKKSTMTSVMYKVKYSTIDRNPYRNFNNPAAAETFVKFLYKSLMESCLYSTRFTFNKFVFKLVVTCSFWVARVIKTTWRRKHFEFRWPEVRF